MTRDEAGHSIIAMMANMLAKLTRSRDLLTQAQRFAVAEALRDAADCLDHGKVMPPPEPTWPLGRRLRRLVRSEKHDHDGSPLFKIVG